MTEIEIKTVTIEQYANVQRALSADDPLAELEYQAKILRAKLQAMGIPTSDIERKRKGEQRN